MEIRLTIFILISTASCIVLEYLGPRWLFYITKPLTTLLIILLPVVSIKQPSLYAFLIIAGLGFSLVGDIFLMLPSDRFLAGLISFLFAHVFYSSAFISDIKKMTWLPVIALILAGMIFVILISPSLGKIKIPVYLYVVFILIMVWMAWERWITHPTQGPLLALIGAGFFAFSDLVLARERFVGRFKSSQALILGSYFIAQLLIASSVCI
jgi:uncharacterized membrane protein YhhN